MKFVKKGIRTMTLLLLGFCLLAGSAYGVRASVMDPFQYNAGDKLYTKAKITKGTKHLTKSTYKKHGMTQYQIVKMSKGKVTLRPQQGMHDSADPYFKKKTVTYKISSKCKFYYRDVTYPYSRKPGYKRVSKKSVVNFMKYPDFKCRYTEIYEIKKKYYVGGYFGDFYMKNGKIVAVITDGGD